MLIQVTEEDIAFGRCGNVGGCPVARAPSREIATMYGWEHPKVFGDHCEVNGVKYRLSRGTHRMIRRYDEDGEIKPFQFRLLPS